MAFGVKVCVDADFVDSFQGKWRVVRGGVVRKGGRYVWKQK